MATTRVPWLGVYLIGAGGLGLALLTLLVAVLAGWLPWPSLIGAWLGGNALIVLLAARRAAGPSGGRRARTRVTASLAGAFAR